jgi:hypothetical protein
MHPSILTTAVALFVGHAASASIFVSTGQTGAQVQCDINHTQHWTYSVSQDVADISGALLTMKRGSQTFATVTFAIFEGTFADFGSANSLLSVTLGPSAFTQSWAPVEFGGGPISLLAGRTYTAVLFSNAADMQSEAYFIKGGSETPLAFVDSSGNPVSGGGEITPPIPAPGALCLLAAAGLRSRRRR